MERTLTLVVEGGAGRPRLDLFLSRRLPIESRSAIQRLIQAGRVLGAQGPLIKPSTRLKPGDQIRVEIPEPATLEPLPEQIPLSILHEDSDLLVVIKPSGMVVHPGAGVRTGTLVNALLGREGGLSLLGGKERPGIVHRLDRDTSGLLVVARHDRAHRFLSRQFATRQVKKTYLAIVWGHPEPTAGRIEKPIGRHPNLRTRMAVRRTAGREALTEYRILEILGSFSLLELSPVTGRTHQIRVHLQSEGHPILGDRRYGGGGRGVPRSEGVRAALIRFGRMALHAARLTFRHPRSGEVLDFEAPLPTDFLLLVDRLRAER